MTLKTSYNTSLNSALDGAFAAGMSFIANPSANYTTLQNALTSAAAAGKNSFSTMIETSFNPEYLKLNGNFLKAYLAGIYATLAAEGIYHTYEVTLSLDTSTVSVTKIKFDFTFTP